MNKKQNYKKEEWGGWKIVSKMLDNSDECGIYPTSKCYQELYDFVCEQKNKARTETSPNTLEAIRHLKMEYANTQLDKRGNGYDWLKKLERKLNE